MQIHLGWLPILEVEQIEIIEGKNNHFFILFVRTYTCTSEDTPKNSLLNGFFNRHDIRHILCKLALCGLS